MRISWYFQNSYQIFIFGDLTNPEIERPLFLIDTMRAVGGILSPPQSGPGAWPPLPHA